MTQTKEVLHTVLRGESLFCLNCGWSHKLIYPILADEFSKKTEQFNALHWDCPKTYVEPTVDQDKWLYEKAARWLANWELGMSSKTMYACFMNAKDFEVSHPHDPDDFKRCYKLLQTVPEWKAKLPQLKKLSTARSNLVDNWDKLTEMYEQNVREEWKNYKQVGMYEFMKTLIVNKRDNEITIEL